MFDLCINCSLYVKSIFIARKFHLIKALNFSILGSYLKLIVRIGNI